MSQAMLNTLELKQYAIEAKISELEAQQEINFDPEVQKKIVELQRLHENTEELQQSILEQNPKLEPPKVDLGLLTNLASSVGVTPEALLAALNFQERRNAIEEMFGAIDGRAAEKLALAAEKIEELKESIEEARNASVLDKIKDAFKYIGMALAVIGSIAGIVAGAVGTVAGGAGVLLVAGSTLLLATAISSILSEATDGKVSIAAGYAEFFKLFGIPDNVADIMGMVYEMLYVIVGCALTLGAGAMSASASFANAAASTAKNAAEMALTVAEKVEKMATKILSIAAFIGGAVAIASGSIEIYQSRVQYDRDMDKAFLKELEAMMDRLKVADEMDLDKVDALMQQFNDLLAAVNQLIDNLNQTGIALASAPSMA